MHQAQKGNQWYSGLKVYAGVNKDSGLIYSVVVTAANVNDLTPAAELLHDDDGVYYDDAGYQGIAKGPEMAGKSTEFRLAMRPGKSTAIQTDGREVAGSTPPGFRKDVTPFTRTPGGLRT